MTPLEKCVCLETAQKLLAAGFPQDTERKWAKNAKYGYFLAREYEGSWPYEDEEENGISIDFAAPDAQEILIEVQKRVKSFEIKWSSYGAQTFSMFLDGFHTNFVIPETQSLVEALATTYLVYGSLSLVHVSQV